MAYTPKLPTVLSEVTWPWSGGGNWVSIDINPFDESMWAAASKSGGFVIGRDGEDPRFHNLGLPLSMLCGADIKWSRTVPGRLIAAGGDGVTTNSYIAICDRADSDLPSSWKTFQTTTGVGGGDNLLCFSDGSAFTSTTSGGVTLDVAGWPRSGGSIIHEDAQATPNSGLNHYVYVGCYYSTAYPAGGSGGTGGVWRLEFNRAENPALVTAVQFSGTGSKSIQSIVGFDDDVYWSNTTSNRNKYLFIAPFDHIGNGAAASAMISTNAPDGAPPSASNMTGTNAPTNVVELSALISRDGAKYCVLAAGLNNHVRLIVRSTLPSTTTAWSSLSSSLPSGLDWSTATLMEGPVEDGTATLDLTITPTLPPVDSVAGLSGTADLERCRWAYRTKLDLTNANTDSATPSHTWWWQTAENVIPSARSGFRAGTGSVIRNNESAAPEHLERMPAALIGHDTGDIVSKIVVSSMFPTRRMLVTKSFVFSSDDSGETWSVHGSPPNGTHKALTVNSAGSRLITTSQEVTCQGTDDYGKSWRALLADHNTASAVPWGTAAWFAPDDKRVFVAGKNTGDMATKVGLFTRSDPWTGPRAPSQLDWACLASNGVGAPLSAGWPSSGASAPAIMGGITIHTGGSAIIAVVADGGYGVYWIKCVDTYASGFTSWAHPTAGANNDQAFRQTSPPGARNYCESAQFAYDPTEAKLYVVDPGSRTATNDAGGDTPSGGGLWRYDVSTSGLTNPARVARWDTPSVIPSGTRNVGDDMSGACVMDGSGADRVWFTHNGGLYYLNDASTVGHQATAESLGTAVEIFLSGGHSGEWAAKLAVHPVDKSLYLATSSRSATGTPAGGGELFRIPVGALTLGKSQNLTAQLWSGYAVFPTALTIAANSRVWVASDGSGIAGFGQARFETVMPAPPSALVASVPDNSVTTAKIVDGAVTVSKLATNSVGTSQIIDDNVTFGKVQNIATSKVLGRSTAGTGNIEELAVTSPLSINSGSVEIAAGAISLSKVENITSARLLGRATTGSGSVEQLTVTAPLSVGAGTVSLPNTTVHIDKLNATGTRSTTTFLRGDNTFATPAGGGGGGTLLSAKMMVYQDGTDTIAVDRDGTVISQLTTSATNNVTVIQAAIDAAMGTYSAGVFSGGGTVLLSDQEYVTNATILLKHGVSLIGTTGFDRHGYDGSGRSTSGTTIRPTSLSVYNISAAGTAVNLYPALLLGKLVNGTSGSVGVGQSITNPHGVELRNISVDMGNVSAYQGIVIADTQYVRVNDCNVFDASGSGGIGIKIISTQSPDDGGIGNRIRNCVIAHCETGIHITGVGATDGQISGGEILQCGEVVGDVGGGIIVEKGGWQISGIHFTCSGVNGGPHITIGTAPTIVSGCYLDTTGDYHIKAGNFCSIIGNIFQSSTNGATTATNRGLIYCSGSAKQSIISNNLVQGNQHTKYFVELNGGGVELRTIITGNIIGPGMAASASLLAGIAGTGETIIAESNSAMSTDLWPGGVAPTNSNAYIWGNRLIYQPPFGSPPSYGW